MPTDPRSDDLVVQGRLIALETRGRRSGGPVVIALAFVEEPDGALVVSASDPDAGWARNLLADPRCRVTMGTRTWVAAATPLEGPEHESAVVGLILRYGTPSERLGSGPSFRLVPQDDGPGATTGGATPPAIDR
jgi:deazaflavin-dependent oxidoreductase (nitroreductase family)